MNKRIIATPLWFLTGWMLGAMAAFVLGLPTWLGPVTAASLAAGVWFDPAGWFWVRPADPVSSDGSGTPVPVALSSVSAKD